MSETSTRDLNLNLSTTGYPVDFQVGPDVQGTGSISIAGNGRTLNIIYAPADPAHSSAVYANDYGRPNIPFPAWQWIQIPNANGVHINYEVQPGGDLKIAWSLS